MKSFATVLAAGVLLAACNNETGSPESKKDSSATVNPAPASEPAPNTLTDAEKAEGWQLLFDGSSTKGWKVFNNKTDGHAWVADSGTLHLDPKEMKDWQTVGGGDLMTEEEFENFDLKLEWKVDTAGNSGIILFSQVDPKFEHSWHTGPEIQVLDNERHGDRVYPKHRAGDLYDLMSSSPETVKPAWEWNQVEIKVNKGKLEEWLNGTKVLDLMLWDDNFKKLVANSKFKDMKDFAKYTKGHIGLQDHGNKVWFRNIKVSRM